MFTLGSCLGYYFHRFYHIIFKLCLTLNGKGNVQSLKCPGRKDTIFQHLYEKTSFISTKSNLSLVFLKNSRPNMTEANISMAIKEACLWLINGLIKNEFWPMNQNRFYFGKLIKFMAQLNWLFPVFFCLDQRATWWTRYENFGSFIYSITRQLLITGTIKIFLDYYKFLLNKILIIYYFRFCTKADNTTFCW